MGGCNNGHVSQRNSRQKRASRRTGSTSPANIYSELVDLLHIAPKPPHREVGAGTRDDQRRGIAPAVAWGWLVRVARSGEAAIDMEKRGYGAETAPLIRSALEHAIRLQWAAHHGDDFIEVALLAQKDGFEKLQAAQTDSWRFDAQLADALQGHAAEASEEYLTLSNLTRLRAIVDSNQERLGSLYMAWLYETQESHPSLMTARHYFQADDTRTTYSLLKESRFASAAALKSCFALVGAMDGYASIAGLSQYIDAPLESIIQRLPSASQLD